MKTLRKFDLTACDKIDTNSRMRMGYFLSTVLSFFFGISLVASNSFALFKNELQTQFYQYANESQPSFYLNGLSQIQSQNFETKIHTYYESGTKGSWSIDPDPLRLDFKFNTEKKSFLWIGREHPLNLTRSKKIEATDAIGAVWTQNQLNALNPRVSGWLGIGLHQNLAENITLLFAYSPLFIPTLGPSLGFSENGDLHPKRYSRLPPASVDTGGTLLPIRYQLEVGQIKELLLQNQFFTGITHEGKDLSVDATFFSAPRPNAVPLTSAKLAVAQNAVTAKVEIEPQFPREEWVTLRLQIKNALFKPTIEWVQGVHDWSAQFASLSGSYAFGSFSSIQFGLLSHMGDESEDPRFSDLLAFIKMPWSITDQLEFKNLIQSTLLNARQSIYWLSEIEYSFMKNFSAIGSVRMLAGQNYSYFGDWRAEDSAGIGMRWTW